MIFPYCAHMIALQSISQIHPILVDMKNASDQYIRQRRFLYVFQQALVFQSVSISQSFMEFLG